MRTMTTQFAKDTYVEARKTMGVRPALEHAIAMALFANGIKAVRAVFGLRAPQVSSVFLRDDAIKASRQMLKGVPSRDVLKNM